MVRSEQIAVCQRVGAEFLASPETLKLGLSRDFSASCLPVNGLRHPAEGDTCGWYIWSGEAPSQDPAYFRPVHVNHLSDVCPSLLKYLGLAPGWRFLVADDFEDIWWDGTLVET